MLDQGRCGIVTTTQGSVATPRNHLRGIMKIVEIESVSLPRELRQYREEDRWVAFAPDGYVSEAVPYSAAIRLANARGGAHTSVGFLVEPAEPATVTATSKPDYSDPVPSYLSRRKRTK
jgi:hypothetical protein